MCKRDNSKGINSSEWWNEYFNIGAWEEYSGEKQTLFFGTLFLLYCPLELKKELINKNYSFCDIGCAFGAATEYLYRTFGGNVTGIDFSESAIKKAIERYPHLKFIRCDLEELPQKYDVIFCSNVLGHLINPYDKLKTICSYAEKYAILLVPYEDDSGEESHINRFSTDLFEKNIPGFEIIAHSIIDTSQLENTFWIGKQALIIYKRAKTIKYMEKDRMEEKKLVPTPETWDQVAETYQLEIERYEYQLTAEIEKILNKMGITAGASLIELGSGSGHLSACLAMRGYKTALFDFSTVALNKARETYDRYGLTGEFIQGDLMSDISAAKQYDVAWNSGVMEHFGDLEIHQALSNAVKFSQKGILFIVPNPKSVSYNLMRARLMSERTWSYGTEYLREDYDHILRRLGVDKVECSYLQTSKMSAHHMAVAAGNGSDIDNLYQLLMENEMLPDSESYLVAYYAFIDNCNFILNNGTSYNGKTELRTKLFDLLTENYGLLANCEKIEKSYSKAFEEENNLQNRINDILSENSNLKNEKLDLTQKLALENKKNEENNENLLSKLAEIEQLKQELTNTASELQEKERFEQELLRSIQELKEDSRTLAKQNLIISKAEQKCIYLTKGKLYKLVHFMYRLKYQGFSKALTERKNFRKWLTSEMKGKGGDSERRYNPLYEVINILRGKERSDEEFINESDSPLYHHLLSEKERFRTQIPDLSEISEIRNIITSRTYKGILVYPHVVYWEPLQTPQQLLKAFAKMGWLCFFCEHPNIKDAFREVELNLIIVHEKELLEAIGNSEVTVLLTWLGSVSFVNEISVKKVWYHILDKLDLFPFYGSDYLELHKKYLLISDYVSYVAQPLLECLKEREDAIYLPNGVSPEEFINIHENFIPEDMKEIIETGNKIIGYYGYLAEWMDFDMVRSAAIARPNYEFVFIGKAICDTSSFDGISNIHLLGLKSYKDLSDYAKLFDVATIPFVINEKMDCVSPIKFYEYCAMGLPVLTSRMKEMEGFVCEFIACSDGCDDYLFYLDKLATQQTKSLAQKNAPAIAYQNTWQARTKIMEDSFDKKLQTILNTNYVNHDLIVLAVIDYDFRYQRPQHFASRYAANGHRVFYINANHFNSNSTDKIQDNLYIVNFHNEEYSAIHLTDWQDQESSLYDQIDHLLNTYCIRDAIVTVDYPNWIYAAKYLRQTYGFKLVADFMDDYTGFLNPAEDLVRKNCELMLQISDKVITSSEFLTNIAKKYCDNVVIVRNGTDYEHFHHAASKHHNDRKIIGYYGAVAEWFDCGKVSYLAKNMPECDIVLIGQVTSGQKQLSRYSNIKMLGEISYLDLPKHLETFDVCLIPFDTSTDLIKATNPVKFYEYLSAGKKIIATEIPELEPFKDKYVYMSNDNQQFLEYVKLCLENNDNLAPDQEKMAFAAQNDWQARYEAFAEACKSSVPKVSIIVLTYNNLRINKLCIDCIIHNTAYPNYELIVVDNLSTDGTREYLRELEQNGFGIKVILNDSNKGFAAGNNVGIQAAGGDYVLLLNNDTLVTRGWLTALAKHFQNNASLGMCGPVTNSIGNEAKIKVTYHNMMEMYSFAYHYTTEHLNEEFKNPKVLALFCTMIKREVIESCGLLDENYQIGMFEDDDYAEAVKQNGYSLAIAEDSFIHHFEGASFKKLEDETFRSIYERNQKLYEKKWCKKWAQHKKREGITWETNSEVDLLS